MSPIPSPTPLRRKLGRLLFSPAGLLFGFVLLLIATCPGARGDDAEAASSRRTGFAAGTDLPTFDLTKPLAAPPAARPFARSTRFDRGAASATRPVQTEDRSGNSFDSFRHSRAVLPLLVDPVIDAAARGATTSLTPMSGPAVGIRPKLPIAK